MNLLAEKYKIIEWLISVEDESIISKLSMIRKEMTLSNSEYNLSDIEKLFVEAGLEDIKEGKVSSHEDVMREVKEKYGM